MTSPVPSASDSGTFRCGFLTSPAVNVMLFHASDEKSEPTCATQKTTIKPNRPLETETSGKNAKSGLMTAAFCGVKRFEKLLENAPVIAPPTKIPKTIKASKDKVFADVKTF